MRLSYKGAAFDPKWVPRSIFNIDGSSGSGTIFSIGLPVASPELTITSSGPTVILTWPTNASAFTLQSTSNLVSSPFWTTVSPAPVVVNGQKTATNLISDTQRFYRLVAQ